ncbi:hypothetical protein GN330_02440 [Nitratireductor sp. CAU 1489]|uniref:Transmembrane protein n=1 Tax=Nitratireductor arenosus TaxID=2682096 RepID=A0A844QAY5_9HYPH|nr:hypothetical protein [Nitratireductor arenosus]MVA96107.1 hypothetical protein [Nitratireductor arenosus]
MVDAANVRPVSGEIMAGGRSRAARTDFASEIVDADYITLDDPSMVRDNSRSAPRVEPGSSGISGMDMLKNHGQHPAGRRERRAGPLFWAVGAMAALAAFWISGGHTLRGALFSAAPASAADAMRLVALRSHLDASGVRGIVHVDGAVANNGASAEQVPRLAIEVRGDGGAVTRYILDPGRARIGPGTRFPFSSRVNAPEGGVAGISVSMITEGGG